MEVDQKAMIVISHPWEFVPKGSSHLNYHTNSVTSKPDANKGGFTAVNSNVNAGGEAPGTHNINKNNHNNNNQELQDKVNHRAMRMPSHQLQGQRGSVKLELNNSSLTDYSYMCWQKTKPLIGNMNFETRVYIYIKCAKNLFIYNVNTINPFNR